RAGAGGGLRLPGHPARAVLRGRDAAALVGLAPARRAAALPADRRVGRRAAARHGVRHRLDPVSRPDASRGPDPGLDAGVGRTRRVPCGGLLHRARITVHPDRRRVPPGDDRVRLDQAALRGGDPRGRRDARRGRRGHGQRGVGRPDPPHARVGPRLQPAAVTAGIPRFTEAESVTEQQTDTDQQAEAAGSQSAADFEGGDRLSTAPRPESSLAVPRLGTWELLRWMWRQLTSMRIALTLLFLLSVAAIPGSLLPQREIDPSKVLQFYLAHKTWAPILDKLQLFDVFESVWFGAIYCLLFISLVGCILPRSLAH